MFLDLKRNWNQDWFFSGSNNQNWKCFFEKNLISIPILGFGVLSFKFSLWFFVWNFSF